MTLSALIALITALGAGSVVGALIQSRLHLALHRPDLQGLDDLDAEIRPELFNAMLFGSDDVIAAMADFVASAGYPAYIRTVTAMRRDLWNKKTAIDEAALSRATAELSPEVSTLL